MITRRGMIAGLGGSLLLGDAEATESELVALSQKKPLIKQTFRPPNFETPLADLRAEFTANEAFFVRYHLAGSPPARELLTADAFRVQVLGKVNTPLKLSVEELRANFDPVEVVAVNQCSGNSRGFSQPGDGFAARAG